MKKIKIIILFLTSILCFGEVSWINLSTLEECSTIALTSDNTIFAGYYDKKGLYRSKDFGQSWELVLGNFDKPNIHSIHDLEVGSNDEKYLYFTNINNIYVTNKLFDDIQIIYEGDINNQNILNIEIFDNYSFCTNWGQVIKFDKQWNPEVIFSGNNYTSVNTISKDSLGVLYIGISNRLFIGNSGLYKSFDDGLTWEDPQLEDEFVTKIEFDSEGRIFVGTEGKVFRSIDNGETFEKVAGDGATIRAMGINSEDAVFVGLGADWGFGGVYVSYDHGDTWNTINEGIEPDDENPLGAGHISDMAITDSGYIFLATNGGVYRSVESTTSVHDGNSLAKTCELEQNYPNPFNPMTTISYSLPTSQFVSIKIFNIMGKEVASLVNGNVKAGIHSVEFNGNNFASGQYFYKIETKGFSKTRRMLLIK